MLFKEKVVYTDILAEYRTKKWGDYYLFDKVLWKNSSHSLWRKGVLIGFVEDSHDARRDVSGEYYEIINDEGYIVHVYPRYVKRDYGEFQAEFEALEESIRLQGEAETLRKELIEKTERANKLYEKGRKAIEANVDNLKLLRSPITN